MTEPHPTQQTVWRLSIHNEEKELTPLPTKYNPDLGPQFPNPTRQTLYDPYFVQSAFSEEKIGINTSKIFTLLIERTFDHSIWEIAKT